MYLHNGVFARSNRSRVKGILRAKGFSCLRSWGLNAMDLVEPNGCRMLHFFPPAAMYFLCPSVGGVEREGRVHLHEKKIWHGASPKSHCPAAKIPASTETLPFFGAPRRKQVGETEALINQSPTFALSLYLSACKM